MPKPSTNVLATLGARQKPDVSKLITEMKEELGHAGRFNFFKRMELNHNTRFCWWPGQTDDGRKWWSEERAANCPGVTPYTGSSAPLNPATGKNTVFPWNGASDVRVPLVDEIINERRTFKRLASLRKQERIGPRELAPEDEPQQKAVLWGQANSYYQDLSQDGQLNAVAQWADIAEEYGHGVVYVGWKSESEVVKRTISADDILQLVATTALQLMEESRMQDYLTEGGREEDAPETFLTPEEQAALLSDAAAELEMMILDPGKRDALVAQIQNFDDEMPVSEARRVAKDLRLGGEIVYYATAERFAAPEWQALTPYVDVFYPAKTTRLQKARWICWAEWVGEAELKARIDDDQYSKTWVEKVLAHKGRAFNEENIPKWVMANGIVSQGSDDAECKEYQILHVYHRATALGNVQALYHTIVHPNVIDEAGRHTCCEHDHGNYPFRDHVRETQAPFLLDSRGVGEISFTQQQEIKVQRDNRVDNASLQIKPPLKVPINRAGGAVNLRPGVQIPMRSNGADDISLFPVAGDGRGSMEVEQTIVDGINAYWLRGQKVDPNVQTADRLLYVADFLNDMRAALLMQFQLIQQFVPDEISSSFLGGQPVNFHASREDIQGQVSVNLEYDVTEIDPKAVEQKLTALTTLLRPLDNQGLLQTGPILKAGASMLFPSWHRLFVADPGKQTKQEIDDEKAIISQMLNGMEGEYVPGGNHQLRLQTLQDIFGLQIDKKGNFTIARPLGKDGQPSRAQKILMEDSTVAAMVDNRVKFHTFQIQQLTENAETGRLGVEPLQMVG